MNVARTLLYRAVNDPKERECGCPTWSRCAHFEGKRVVLTALTAMPERHRRHAPYVHTWRVTFFRGPVTFRDCPVCGVARGEATGPMTHMPLILYQGFDADLALGVFEDCEAQMVAEVRSDN